MVGAHETSNAQTAGRQLPLLSRPLRVLQLPCAGRVPAAMMKTNVAFAPLSERVARHGCAHAIAVARLPQFCVCYRVHWETLRSLVNQPSAAATASGETSVTV